MFRLVFSTHQTNGHFIKNVYYGIISGVAPLREHKGIKIVAEGLDSIWHGSDSRPDIVFSDTAYW